MKRANNAIASILISLSVGLATTEAHATASANATLDWSNLSINFLTGSGTYSTSDTYTYASVSNCCTSSWDDNLNAVSLSIPGATASGNASSLNASATASYSGAPGYQAEASAYSQLEGQLILNSGSIVSITIPYTVSAIVSPPSENSPYESALAESLLQIGRQGHGTTFQLEASASAMADSISYPTSNDSGNLNLLFQNNSSGLQTFAILGVTEVSTLTSVVSSVPELGSASMYLIGLGLLAGIYTRQRQASGQSSTNLIST